MPKTQAQILHDFEFQNPGETILDIIDYLDDPLLRQSFSFLDEGRMIERIIEVINKPNVTNAKDFLNEGELLKLIIISLNSFVLSSLLMDGDSWVAGASSIGIADSIHNMYPDINITNTATGGSHLLEQRIRIQNNPEVGEKWLIHCDGSSDGNRGLALDMIDYDAIWAATGGKVIFITSVIRSAMSPSEKDRTIAVNDELKKRYPDNTIDIMEIAEGLAPNVSGDVNPSLLQGDGLHPTEPYADAIAQAAYNQIYTVENTNNNSTPENSITYNGVIITYNSATVTYN